MSPVLNTCMAVLFLLTGAGAGAIMLELKGKSRDRAGGAALVRLHRILGYTFVALFSFMTVLMIRKAGAYQEELSVRVVCHVALGLVLISPKTTPRAASESCARRFFSWLAHPRFSVFRGSHFQSLQ